MRILYFSQYFPPEAGATQARAYEMASNWILLGHSVTMIAEFPNHPSGIMAPGYQGKLYERELLNGIEVLRVWVKTSPSKNFRTRMLFYLSYMFNAAMAGLFIARGRYSFIYASSPPLLVGAAAWIVSKFRRIPLVFEVRDLWPESAVALGELTNSRAIAMATRLEEMCYRRAVRIVVVTQGVLAHLLKRGIPDEKLLLIPNGANTELFIDNNSERDRIRQELGLGNKFICIYAGIFGVAQGLEVILETAQLLQSDKRFHFLLIGEGPRKGQIASLARNLNLPNLTLLPEKPREQIPNYLSAADAAIIPLRKSEVFSMVVPSKLFDAWSCSKPVILSVDGEARILLENVKGGIFVPPESAEKMAEAVKSLQASPDLAQLMGCNGLEFTRANFSRKTLALQLITELSTLFTRSGKN